MRFAIASGDVLTAAAPCGLLKFTAPMSHGMMISSAYEPPGYHANRRTEPQQRDRHRLQVRRARRRERPLRVAHVAPAVGAETPVEPGLLTDPVGGVPPVGHLVEVAVRAAGPIRAARRLEHVAVAARREHRTEAGAAHAGAAVGRALQDRRRIVDAHGMEEVGEQLHAIGHRHRDVALDLDLVRRFAHRNPRLPFCRSFSPTTSRARRRLRRHRRHRAGTPTRRPSPSPRACCSPACRRSRRHSCRRRPAP